MTCSLLLLLFAAFWWNTVARSVEHTISKKNISIRHDVNCIFRIFHGIQMYSSDVPFLFQSSISLEPLGCHSTISWYSSLSSYTRSNVCNKRRKCAAVAHIYYSNEFVCVLNYAPVCGYNIASHIRV